MSIIFKTHFDNHDKSFGDLQNEGDTKDGNNQVELIVMQNKFSLTRAKGRHKRESKNAKQMRNTKQNCFSHSSASLRNDKQCSAKQCFANQTNRCLAGFASRSDLFRDNARLTKHRRKVNQRHLILQAMYTTM